MEHAEICRASGLLARAPHLLLLSSVGHFFRKAQCNPKLLVLLCVLQASGIRSAGGEGAGGQGEIPIEAGVGSLQPYRHTQELMVARVVLKAYVGFISPALEAPF